MNHLRSLRVAVIPGDGIGVDVVASAIAVLEAVEQRTGGCRFDYQELYSGARRYLDTGEDRAAESVATARDADAILLVEAAVHEEFASGRVRPVELGGDQGTVEVADTVVSTAGEPATLADLE